MLMSRMPQWLASNFGLLSWEQIAFHLSAENAGIPWRLVKSSIRELILKPVALLLITFLIFWFIRDKLKNLYRYLAVSVSLVALVVAGGGAIQTWQVSGLDEIYLSNSDSGSNKNYDWMAELYVPVRLEKPLQHAKQLNLIWIYIESLEESRVSEEKHIDIFRAKARIREFQNLPGTGWTIGGMVSSQCALPLMPFGLFSGNSFSDVPEFMKGITCLGDVLESRGYHTNFIGGANVAFAGKEKFLKQHGYKKITGKQEIQNSRGLKLPDGWWGFTDDQVFQIAKEDLRALHRIGQPFFYSALTLDTHGPKGYLSDYCRRGGYANNIASIFDCVLSQIQEFAEELKQEGILENTVLVISGDHPFMEPRKISINPFKYEKRDKDRKVFFAVIRPDGVIIDTKFANHFDMFPTVLSSLGFEIPNGRIGLGRNLFDSTVAEPTYSSSEFSRRLRAPSSTYIKAWEGK
jgi:phosphoglycerol transferase